MGIFKKKNEKSLNNANLNQPHSYPAYDERKLDQHKKVTVVPMTEEEKEAVKNREDFASEGLDKLEETPISIENIDKEKTEEEKNEEKDVIKKYTGFDFASLSKEKMFSVISELILYIKTLENNVKKYDSESDGIYEDYKRKSNDLKDLNKKIEALGRKLSSTFNEKVSAKQGFKVSPDEIIEYIVSDYLHEKKRYQERVIKLEKEKFKDKKLLDSLKNQMTKMVDGEINIKSEDGEGNYSEEDIDNFEGNENQKDDVKIIAVDVKKAREALGETEYNILGILGKDGLSLYPDIEEEAVSKFGYTESKIKTSIQRLEEHNLIISETVKTPKIRRGVRVLEITSEVGFSLYEEKFNKKPVESEKRKIIKDHDNLEHGYSIVEVARILEHQLGYIDVSHDRAKNTIPVGGNKKWVPDIIALNPVSNKKEYFEVEFGNHTQENFDEKMTKANLKAKVLRFIVPNALKKQKLKTKIDQWRAKGDNKKSKMIISVGTVSDLEEKEYGSTVG